MSLFERLTEDTPEAGQLTEMCGMGVRPMRHVDPRDLQYSLEDSATACDRMWAERKRWRRGKDSAGLTAKHKSMVESLRSAAAASRAYAEARDKADRADD